MSKIISYIVAVAAFVLGIYVGVWKMLLAQIINLCNAYDNGTLTGILMGTAILKCFFAGASMVGIWYLGCIIAVFIRGL